jgi:hypothetical protein
MEDKIDKIKSAIAIKNIDPGFSVGDEVKINQFYLANYVGMEKHKDVPVSVVGVYTRPIKAENLSAQSGDRARFLEKYGPQEIYQIVELHVKYPGDTRKYVVSPFGYNKV